MIPIIFVDGKSISPEFPGISPLDRGLTLGDGLFETLKVEDGLPWYLDRHLTRLEHAAQRIGIPYSERIREWINSALKSPIVTTQPSLALRITLTRGVTQTQGLAGAGTVAPTTVIAIYPPPVITPTIYATGLSLHLASAPRNERAYTTGLKTTSYVESVLALREAQLAKCDDALFLDTRGYVSEATASNVFAWIDDVLVTPPLSCGILPGITRAVILEIAHQHGIPAEERILTFEEFVAAQELFCTSSLRSITPIGNVEGRVIGDGMPGAQTLQLMTLYAAHQRI